MESERIDCLDLCNTAFPIAMGINRSQKHVSIILDKKGKIVSIGTNTRKTHPKAQEHGYRFCELHSELDCYLRVPDSRRSEKLTLVNFRFNRFGDMRMSRPCSKCMPWCKAVFERIIYTTDYGFEEVKDTQ